MASPTRGVSQPIPPPRVRPPIPVSGWVPSGAAKLWGASAESTSRIFAPPWAVTTMRSGSTTTPFIFRRLMRNAPFGMHMGEWPPESTATFCPAASLTTACTSCTVVGIAITLGQSLTLLFQQSSRALRYADGSLSCGVKNLHGSASVPVALDDSSTLDGTASVGSRGPLIGIVGDIDRRGVVCSLEGCPGGMELLVMRADFYFYLSIGVF